MGYGIHMLSPQSYHLAFTSSPFKVVKQAPRIPEMITAGIRRNLALICGISRYDINLLDFEFFDTNPQLGFIKMLKVSFCLAYNKLSNFRGYYVTE